MPVNIHTYWSPFQYECSRYKCTFFRQLHATHYGLKLCICKNCHFWNVHMPFHILHITSTHIRYLRSIFTKCLYGILQNVKQTWTGPKFILRTTGSHYETPHFIKIYFREPLHLLPSKVERDQASLCGSCCWLTQRFKLHFLFLQPNSLLHQ